MRVVVIGNSGSGKSTLAKQLSKQIELPLFEIDALLWEEGWVLRPAELYSREHASIINADSWLIEGLGRQDSIASRIDRASHIILTDFPIWQHYWLAAERQISWSHEKLKSTPGGISKMPSTKAIFETIHKVDKEWMPDIRRLVSDAERDGKMVRRISSFEALKSFSWIAQ